VPRSLGGLNWGRGPVALVLTVPILIAVAYMATTGIDRTPEDSQPLTRPRHRAA
jgi:hypothetical protein